MLPAWLLVLAFEDQAIARGVVWRAHDESHAEPPQQVHELVLDLDDPELVLRLVEPGPNTCASVDEIAARAELVDGRPPVAAINVAFFAPWAPCLASSQAVSLMQQHGETLARNHEGQPRAALGWTIEGELLTTIVPAGDAWPQARFALGARGLLIAEGRDLEPARWRDDERLSPEFTDARHPRTALGVDLERNAALLVTVDGRRPSAAGMNLVELRTRMRASEGLELDAAINLDGGGSTTMWIAGRGIVNQPSDQAGPRAVIGALLVYAAPLEPAPLESPEPPSPEPASPEPPRGCSVSIHHRSPLPLLITLPLLIALLVRRPRDSTV